MFSNFHKVFCSVNIIYNSSRRHMSYSYITNAMTEELMTESYIDISKSKLQNKKAGGKSFTVCHAS